MFSYWAYVLVGENNTGKTTFQRHLMYLLCGERYQRLPSNTLNKITHPRAPNGLEILFTANRSYQEKKSEYKSVENYFKKFFKDGDACFLSSHSNMDDVREMIVRLRRRFYNVAGVFWSNASGRSERDIAGLPWDEVLWINNPTLRSTEAIEEQLSRLATEFSEMLLARAQFQ